MIRQDVYTAVDGSVIKEDMLSFNLFDHAMGISETNSLFQPRYYLHSQ